MIWHLVYYCMDAVHISIDMGELLLRVRLRVNMGKKRQLVHLIVFWACVKHVLTPNGLTHKNLMLHLKSSCIILLVNPIHTLMPNDWKDFYSEKWTFLNIYTTSILEKIIKIMFGKYFVRCIIYYIGFYIFLYWDFLHENS